MDELPTTWTQPTDATGLPLPIPPDNAPLSEVEGYWCLPLEFLVDFNKLHQGEWREPRIEGFLTLVRSLYEMGVMTAATMYTLAIRNQTTKELHLVSLDGNHRRIVFPKYNIPTWRTRLVYLDNISQIPSAHLRTLAAGANALHSKHSIQPTEFEILDAVKKAKDALPKTLVGKARSSKIVEELGKYFLDFTTAKYEHYQMLINVSI